MDTWPIGAIISGVASHLLLYRHGEWDVKSLGVAQTYGLLILILCVIERIPVLDRLEIVTPTNWAFKSLGYHILGIYLSILLYRGFWHRLSGFPGPYLANYSNFYVTSLSAKNFQLCDEVEKLHLNNTTAATLTNLFFHIASEPSWQVELQEELDALSNLSQDKLVGLNVLEALINETLRLHPPVPSGTQRMTPSEGITIGDQYIPGDVMVCIPSHTIFRDGRIFDRSKEFLPERWTTQPELVKEPSAFIPFNAGPYACVGKQLALMELRRVVAEIFTRYDVSFAPEQTKSAFLEGKRDTFTLVAGFAFYAIYWHQINGRPFGNTETDESGEVWKERLNPLNENQQGELERLFMMKLNDNEDGVFAWDPDEYTEVSRLGW
ncbi:hypothetical protein PEBR_41014 [Penicillium brasilianum]|uniref:Cytochrome P450 n=1 Tax=Penicillium brasilianum TaxID=104259 RepID=A0A1S9R8W3_PENBI|nr:hypothetical protein PEBR_41014 [Penicillium brasilianum]